MKKQTIDGSSWQSDEWDSGKKHRKKYNKKDEDGMKHRNGGYDSQSGSEAKYDKKKIRNVIDLDASKSFKMPTTSQNSNQTTPIKIAKRKNQDLNMELRTFSSSSPSGPGTEPGTPLSTAYNTVENTPSRMLENKERKGGPGTPQTPTPKGFMNSPKTSKARTSPKLMSPHREDKDTIPNSPDVATPGHRGQFAMTSAERNQIDQRDSRPFFPNANSPSQSRMNQSPHGINGRAEDSPGTFFTLTERMGLVSTTGGIASVEKFSGKSRNISGNEDGNGNENGEQRDYYSPGNRKEMSSTPSKNVPRRNIPQVYTQDDIPDKNSPNYSPRQSIPHSMEFIPSEGCQISLSNEHSRHPTHPITPNVSQSPHSTYDRPVMLSPGRSERIGEFPLSNGIDEEMRKICRENSRGSGNYVRKHPNEKHGESEMSVKRSNAETPSRTYNNTHGSPSVRSDDISTPNSEGRETRSPRKRGERKLNMEEGRTHDYSPGNKAPVPVCTNTNMNKMGGDLSGRRDQEEFDRRILNARARSQEGLEGKGGQRGDNQTTPPHKNRTPSPNRSPMNEKNYHHPPSQSLYTSLQSSSRPPQRKNHPPSTPHVPRNPPAPHPPQSQPQSPFVSSPPQHQSNNFSSPERNIQIVYQLPPTHSSPLSTAPHPSDHLTKERCQIPYSSPGSLPSSSYISQNLNFNTRSDPRSFDDRPTQQSPFFQHPQSISYQSKSGNSPHRDMTPSRDWDNQLPPSHVNRTPAPPKQPKLKALPSPAPSCLQNSPESRNRNRNQFQTDAEQSPAPKTPRNRTNRPFSMLSPIASPSDDFSPAVASVIESWRTAYSPDNS